jgi:GH35 family endo-1,4-beta-xylanase
MNRRAFLRSMGLTAAAVAARPVWRAPAAEASDQEILAQAQERIRLHRQGDGVVVVRGSDGQPVRGATVKLEQVRHEFLFGCNIFRFGRLPTPELESQYRQRFAALLNFATLGFYWPMYEPVQGQPQYAYTDQVLDWCAQQQIRCKGHPLVWDFADPRWLPQDFEEIRRLSHARVRDIIKRFKGRIDIWDVVNEPTHLGRFKTRLGQWAQSLGAVPYVAEHLRVARAANPEATLLVNDYRTDPEFEAILDQLRQHGRLLFDAIGIQSHMHDSPWPLRRVWAVCDRFAKFGVPLHFTETTVVSGPRRGPGRNWQPTNPEGEARQADYVPQFYTVLFGHPAVQAITWWDFSDHGAWQGAAAGLVRADMSPKPVYERLMELIKGQWWTRAEGRTDGQGRWPVRAYYGWHRVTAILPDGRSVTEQVRWQRNQPSRFELQVA